MDWQRPEVDPTTITRLYAELIRHAPAGVGVWFDITGSTIHFYTVLDEKLVAEDAVYEAERTVLERFDASLVDFRVFPNKGPLKAYLKKLTPLLQPLDALRG
jgi:hypothetical protein